MASRRLDRQLLDRERLLRMSRRRAARLERPEHRLAALGGAEQGVLAVQQWGMEEREEELAAVGAGAGVRRAQEARPVVLHAGGELAVEAITGSAHAAAERAAALRHELRDHAMEPEPIIEAE